MKPYSGFKAQETAGARAKLPAGGYVCTIMSAKEDTYSNGNHVLIIAIDVTEGEYKGFWKSDYDNNTNEDKKWRGTVRVNVPKDDGSEQDAWTKRQFENSIWAIEQSNPGYHWDWDEKKLKGKTVGVIYRNREWEMNGNTGWTTEAGALTSVDKIRNNTFRPLKDKPLVNKAQNASQTASGGFTEVAEDESDLPF